MPRSKKKVYQYNAAGNYINEYESITEAAKELGLNTGSLSRSIRYGWKHGGYNWSGTYSEIYKPPPKDEILKNVEKGNVYTSDKFGDYIVTRFSHRDVSKRKHYYVKFKNTGFEESFDTASIKRGDVVDYRHPTVEGVGYLGSREHVDNKIRDTWRMMIRRCYSDFESAHLYENTTVDERWHNLQTFAEDVALIDGYDENKFNAGQLVLDKDKKQKGKKYKMYSLDTCTFISMGENMSISDRSTERVRRQTLKFTALSPEGIFYRTRNASEFGRRHGLNAESIRKALHGEGTLHGWVFGDAGMSKEDLERIHKREK